MRLAAGAGFYGVARLCFSLLRGGCEATLVFYNWKFKVLSPVCFGVFYALVVFRACVGGTRIQTAVFEMRAGV